MCALGNFGARFARAVFQILRPQINPPTTDPKPVVAKTCYEPNIPANVQFFATDQLVGHGSQKPRFSRLAPPLPPAPPSSALRINNSVGKKCDLLILAAADETAVEHFS